MNKIKWYIGDEKVNYNNINSEEDNKKNTYYERIKNFIFTYIINNFDLKELLY
jgi:hypothetical protein